jgi:hypothetical protein
MSSLERHGSESVIDSSESDPLEGDSCAAEETFVSSSASGERPDDRPGKSGDWEKEDSDNYGSRTERPCKDPDTDGAEGAHLDGDSDIDPWGSKIGKKEE